MAPDVIHSWWIPALGGKIQAIPGRINHTWFEAERPGTYEGQCAELCGLYHASMLAKVVAYPAPGSAPAMPSLGRQEWQGVCATCHGNLGQGGYGPNIANNSLLTNVAGLRRTLRFGVTGPTGAMPPVGDTWSSAQIQALVDYMKKSIYKAAPIGG